MTNYAFGEIYDLIQVLDDQNKNESERDATLRYICALFSELAYYHIPQWEIDQKKRIKLVPCESYRSWIKGGGAAIDLNIITRNFDFPGFEISTPGVVAIGRLINKKLFIGIRGTAFLYDWRLNVRAKLAAVNTEVKHDHWLLKLITVKNVRFHSGFAYEALRLYPLIKKALNDKNLDPEDIYICGHSLGGAVAAILQELLLDKIKSVYIFAAPRYADLSAYFNRDITPPIQTRRPGDIVPIVPPRFMGYVDHPHELSTDGTEYFDPSLYSRLFGDLIRWGCFLFGRLKSHNMETYRNEVGQSSGISGANLALINVEKIKKEHLGKVNHI
ncbi:lipase family protein [Raoultella terrigena]|uniref:lipase family protein n=1 Tax=Raoultella terrigena TaxID=577 RepID=UPI0038504F6E